MFKAFKQSEKGQKKNCTDSKKSTRFLMGCTRIRRTLWVTRLNGGWFLKQLFPKWLVVIKQLPIECTFNFQYVRKDSFVINLEVNGDIALSIFAKNKIASLTVINFSISMWFLPSSKVRFPPADIPLQNSPSPPSRHQSE